MNGEPHTVEVKIGRFALRLSPLQLSDVEPLGKTLKRLQGFRSGEREAQLKEIENVLGFVFISARKSDPGLSLADLYDEATVEEIEAAVILLAEITGNHWCGGK